MGWLNKLNETASNAGKSAQRQARRARLEVSGARIERRIRSRKTAIGTAVYPELKSGGLSVDIPEVTIAMTAIAALEDELHANRAALAALKDGNEAEGDDDASR